ncbi:MAG: hypothetical protein IPF91_14195 [Saprospiraceae bacterium]|nr:hypothetical protein [Candidatus Brachybacter algidus]
MKERLFSPCKNYQAVCSLKADGDDSEEIFFAETIFEEQKQKRFAKCFERIINCKSIT